jgi:hypothetical protein
VVGIGLSLGGIFSSKTSFFSISDGISTKIGFSIGF